MKNGIFAALVARLGESPSGGLLLLFATYVLYHRYRYMKNPLQSLPRASDSMGMLAYYLRKIFLPGKDQYKMTFFNSLLADAYRDRRNRPLAVLWTSPITDSAVVFANSLPEIKHILVQGQANYSGKYFDPHVFGFYVLCFIF